MDKQLRYSFLGIYNVWEYEFNITKRKLFGITLSKSWGYDSNFPGTKNRGFWKKD